MNNQIEINRDFIKALETLKETVEVMSEIQNNLIERVHALEAHNQLEMAANIAMSRISNG